MTLCFGCKHEEKKKAGSNKDSTNYADNGGLKQDPKKNSGEDDDFEKRIYLKIDEMETARVYTDKNRMDVFNRVLVIPEEENIMLIVEKISIGEEGAGFKLVKRTRLTDDNTELSKFGLQRVDSLKFIDSVTLSGYFNNKKLKINVETNKVVN